MLKILVIIPARGGSKGIPRKNLRSLNAQPLISYSINTALKSKYNADVYVSSEDEEILSIAESLGAKIHLRNSELANDKATLDPVIYNAYKEICLKEDKQYDLIVTMQATSPLLKVNTLDGAIEKIAKNPSIDTVISAINDTHLTWNENGNTGYSPNYEARVNRQYLPPVYKETGGFLITRSSVINSETRIGKNVQLSIITNQQEAIDIDGYQDWNLCEFYLKRKTIVIVVSGYTEIGLGHVYNTLILANEILNHRLVFLVDSKSQLALEKIRENNYEAYRQGSENIVDDIAKFNPSLIINDRLDTEESYVLQLKAIGAKVLNIEDLGPGSMLADRVINAIYPEKKKVNNHYYGGEYFCAREEFFLVRDKEYSKDVKSVLISYGGVDPNNLTKKTLEAIYDYCVNKDIEINVIAGIGYGKYESLNRFGKVKIHKDVKNIAKHMHKADIAFSSAGRTVYELAIVGTPSIILAQNKRELTHFFASEQNGFINIGLGKEKSLDDIKNVFTELVSNYDKRVEMHSKMKKQNVLNGKRKVIKIINDLIEEL